jgi:hypothetical protein
VREESGVAGEMGGEVLVFPLGERNGRGLNSANSFHRRVPRRLFRAGDGGSGVGNLGQGGFGKGLGFGRKYRISDTKDNLGKFNTTV